MYMCICVYTSTIYSVSVLTKAFLQYRPDETLIFEIKHQRTLRIFDSGCKKLFFW